MKYSLHEIIPHLELKCRELNIPLFSPRRELSIAAFVGGKLNPYRPEAQGFQGPSWEVDNATIKAMVEHLRTSESYRRAFQKHLQEAPHRGQGLGKIVPLNRYSRESEHSEQDFYQEVIKQDLPIFDFVQVCQSAIQVQVIESESFSALSKSMAESATIKRMAAVCV